MNDQIVKLWVQNEISKINYKKEMGFILPVVADAKIDLLERFYDDFNLDSVNIEIQYHAEV